MLITSSSQSWGCGGKLPSGNSFLFGHRQPHLCSPEQHLSQSWGPSKVSLHFGCVPGQLAKGQVLVGFSGLNNPGYLTSHFVGYSSKVVWVCLPVLRNTPPLLLWILLAFLPSCSSLIISKRRRTQMDFCIWSVYDTLIKE